MFEEEVFYALKSDTLYDFLLQKCNKIKMSTIFIIITRSWLCSPLILVTLFSLAHMVRIPAARGSCSEELPPGVNNEPEEEKR